MTVSIIIPVKRPNRYLEECIANCLNLDYPEFEIIILPDETFVFNHPRVKIIPTGNLTPPLKRDYVLKIAKGEILAFLDDDAYPRSDWLKNAIIHFQDQDIACVCGPAVTPRKDSLTQQVSGLVYSSILVGGNYVYRYTPLHRRYIDDYPSCNFFIRRSVFQELGGFKVNYWPGEDTFLCLKVTSELKKKILYDPNVLVWHHRRSIFLPHLKQISNYALHRGYFVKKYPANSLKISYFLPSVLFLGLCLGAILSFLTEYLRVFFFSFLITYLIVALIVTIYELLKNKTLTRRLLNLVFWGIILTHLSYGVWFLKGIFSRRLKEEQLNE